MMGEQKSERELFSYAVNLEKRMRSDHRLWRVAALIDFKFVREEVAHCYGNKGNISVDPVASVTLNSRTARSSFRGANARRTRGDKQSAYGPIHNLPFR